MRTKTTPYVMVLLMLLLPMLAQATVARPLSFDELVKSSGIVFHGWVVEQWAEAPEGLPGIIYTKTVFEVASVLKGEPNKRVELRQIGGEIGDYTVALSGVPHFELGQEVVVFAGRDDAKSPFVPTALAQGVFFVDRGADELSIYRDLSGITFHDTQPRQFSLKSMPDRLPMLIEEVQMRWADLIETGGE